MRKYLYDLRKANNLSQREVADKLDISESYYCQIEKGNRKQKLDLALACKLSRLFNVDISRISELERSDNSK